MDKLLVKQVPAHVKGMAFPKRQPWVPKIPDWPVIPKEILQIAAAAEAKAMSSAPLIAARFDSWIPVGEPDQIEVVRVGIQLAKRKPITDEEADIIGGY